MAFELSDEALVSRADEIAEKAHQGQLDKIGRPYIDHPRRVAARLDTADAKAAALLHDVIEDSELTAADLRAEGIPRRVVDAVVLLTRCADVPDAVYYRRILGDELAHVVKLADLADNTDPRRLAQIGEPLRTALREKYRNAYAALGAPELAPAL
ncbi:HD domain-containing protein [Mycobacterium sp. PS03-16]|uniref:HD domain-containing protein n=1 Tax=Mycobacterium sp. PS03-16 TaxID=2559611 RepID=UPI0010746466|nr:HD domain-containing protein [Mycobacterium sp. PS03-16]TFV56380.1 HD domain-containing protein [Mycobacterium sp. PS03-16]